MAGNQSETRQVSKTTKENNMETYALGNEPGYRRLETGELVQEGDETFGVFGDPWTPAHKYQIGNPAYKVGGFSIWRRKL